MSKVENGTIRIVALAGASLMVAAAAHAGTGTSAPESIGKETSANLVQLDLNNNFVFDGVGGGDTNFGLALAFGTNDVIVVADSSGDGIDEVHRYTDNTFTYVDANNNFAWNGTGGGDSSFSFAPGQGFQTPVVGDYDLDNAAEWGLYNSSTDLFILDVNGNGSFDGIGGGDANFAVASVTGPGTPVVGDFDGDGDSEVGKVNGSQNWQIDANTSFGWEGTGGGDSSIFFSPGSSGGTIPLVGDWDGDGDDDIGNYDPANDQFRLDLNDNLSYDGAGGGDVVLVLSAASGAGTPFVCDLDGDGDDEVGKVVGANHNIIADLNGNNVWDGVGGGDLNGFFGPGSGLGAPLCGKFQ